MEGAATGYVDTVPSRYGLFLEHFQELSAGRRPPATDHLSRRDVPALERAMGRVSRETDASPDGPGAPQDI